MQFIENSVIGLRASKWLFLSAEHDAEVTLFPMVHLGEAGFYKQVYDDALAHDYVIYEGIDAPATRALTRSYRWLNPERLGLIQQPRLPQNASNTILADLSAEEFTALWKSISWPQRGLVSALASAVGLTRRFALSRAALARGMCTNDLTSREDTYAKAGELASLHHLLLTARDERLCAVLLDLLSKTKGLGARIAVIYGAAHMPAVQRALASQAGFRPESGEWLTVFSK